MNDFEAKPRFFNSYTLILIGSLIIVTGILGVAVYPRLFQLYLDFPNDESIRTVIWAVIIPPIFLSIIFGFVIRNIVSRKIVVKENLLYFYIKPLLKNWTAKEMIDVSKIDLIKDKVENGGFIATGRTVVPIIYSWLIFVSNDKREIKLNMIGWDVEMIKRLFNFIKDKYPKVIFNTRLRRDSSEKISGLDEYLKK